MIYLDNSATTKPNDSVLTSYLHVSEKYFANASSLHHLGGEAERLLNSARKQIASLFRVESEEIIFTSGGTEGNNLAIKGIALQHQNRGKHIITTAVEHPSVYDACSSLEDLGFEITYLNVDQEGHVSIDELRESIRKDTILVSVMHVNNEIGTIQPVKEIGELLKEYPTIYFHVDDVQGLGKVPLDLSSHLIDLCTFSGHKIHGLKGTGILYKRKGIPLYSLFHGGNQEQSFRSGTENLAGAVSIAKAVRLIKENERKHTLHLEQLHEYLYERLKEVDRIKINTTKDAAPHIMNISIPGMKPEIMIHALAERGIYISTKSACSSKEESESRILIASGFDSDRAKTALRISLAYTNTKDEIDLFIQALKEEIVELIK